MTTIDLFDPDRDFYVERNSLRLALKAIAEARVEDAEDPAELAALLIATARAELDKREATRFAL